MSAPTAAPPGGAPPAPATNGALAPLGAAATPGEPTPSAGAETPPPATSTRPPKPTWVEKMEARRERKGARELGEAKAERAKLEQERAQLAKDASEHQRLQKLMRTDPEAYLEETARAAGVHRDEFFHRLNARRLQGTDEPTTLDVNARVTQLEQQLEQERAAAKKEREQGEKRSAWEQAQARRQQDLRSFEALALDIPETDQTPAATELRTLQQRWPALAMTHPERLKREAAATLAWAEHKHPELLQNLDELADMLDQRLAAEYSYQQAWRDRRQPAAAPPPSPEAPTGAAGGAGQPRKPPGVRRPSNQTAASASTGVQSRRRSQAEREAAIARRLPDFER